MCSGINHLITYFVPLPYLYQIHVIMKVKVLVAQSCLTFCDPMDSSPPGFSVKEFSWQEYWSG